MSTEIFFTEKYQNKHVSDIHLPPQLYILYKSY